MTSYRQALPDLCQPESAHTCFSDTDAEGALLVAPLDEGDVSVINSTLVLTRGGLCSAHTLLGLPEVCLPCVLEPQSKTRLHS